MDIGGTYDYWKNIGWNTEKCEIYLLNLTHTQIPTEAKNFHSIVGNAMELPYKKGDFDIVFSNSVIEHMGSREGQVKFAKEVLRIADKYIIQTPSLWFPLEPHCRIPFFQFIPHSLRAFPIMLFNINYFPKAKTYKDAVAVSKTTIMLTKKEFQKLFPNAIINVEKLFGITKSYTAINY